MKIKSWEGLNDISSFPSHLNIFNLLVFVDSIQTSWDKAEDMTSILKCSSDLLNFEINLNYFQRGSSMAEPVIGHLPEY